MDITSLTVLVLELILVLCLVTREAKILRNVTVSTGSGDVIGQRHVTAFDLGDDQVTDTVDVFLGIPYAIPPTGDLRFEPPHAPTRWTTPLVAHTPGPVCPQKPYYSQTKLDKQSEDCLYLNIYSPRQERNSSATYPVMVFIHGGSNEEGAGSRYNGLALAQYGVVVVTINYRLGLLGFLTNGKATLPGNYGLLDQIEALRWISENIDHFRGESCKVTLFGSSAGSADIGLLMTSPEARGLFDQVIMQSGSPLAFWAVYNSSVDHEEFFQHVASFLECDDVGEDETDPDGQRVQCLRKLHFQNITDAYENFTRITPSTALYKPRVDGYIIPDTPEAMFKRADYKNLSVMTGTVENEWNRNMGWFLEDLPGVDTNYSDGMDRDSLERGIHHVIVDRLWWSIEVASAVLFEYTNWETTEPNPYDNRESYATFMSDLVMVAPTVQLADLLLEHGTPVYQYHFNYSTSGQADKAWYKCYHTLELDYVFGSPFLDYNIALDRVRNHSEEDRLVSRTVMSLWTNFAKNGNPNMDTSSNVEWPRLDPSLKPYAYIGSPPDTILEIRNHIRPKRMAFWNVLVPQLLVAAGINANVSESKERPTDMKLTLMWFFGILACLSFIVMLAVVVRNGKIKKKLTKALAMSPQVI